MVIKKFGFGYTKSGWLYQVAIVHWAYTNLATCSMAMQSLGMVTLRLLQVATFVSCLSTAMPNGYGYGTFPLDH